MVNEIWRRMLSQETIEKGQQFKYKKHENQEDSDHELL